MKLISIVVVTYNSEKDIYDCVKSIKDHADIPLNDIELIIVDNESNEPASMFRRLQDIWGDDIVIIQNNKNGGYGQGNNVGIRESTAPVIMIMNPDVRILKPVFTEALKAFNKDSNIVLVGMTQRKKDGTIGRSTSWTTRIHPYIAEPLRFICGKMNIFWDKYMYVCGACFFLRKAPFEKVGMFDENIFMYGEEDDIHYRLMKLPKARMTYIRHCSYYHYHDETKDFCNNDYKWMKDYLKTLLYMDKRDGISPRRTISWAIKRNNISLLKESIINIISRGRNAKRLAFYKGWDAILKNSL